MSKLNERLTLVANLSVVAGIVFLGVEMRQNTDMMRAQIRDSITEKQMEYLGWRATSPELSAIIVKAQTGDLGALVASERSQFVGWVNKPCSYW